MKSKEEIVNKWLEEDVYGEPLSELDLNECGEIEFRGLKSGFISGYTQCQEDMADTSKVTRFEVIDENGRAYTQRDCNVELSYQDDGKTLKVFIKPNKQD